MQTYDRRRKKSAVGASKQEPDRVGPISEAWSNQELAMEVTSEDKTGDEGGYDQKSGIRTSE
jgi:hypothetical protein